MAVLNSPIRQGLPRHKGGEPWPVVDYETLPSVTTEASTERVASAASDVLGSGSAAASTTKMSRLRRGLPRLAGGESWPPDMGVIPKHLNSSAGMPLPGEAYYHLDNDRAVTLSAGSGTAQASLRPRRGLPRTAGGDPWPRAVAVVRPRHVSLVEAEVMDLATTIQEEPVTRDVAMPDVATAETVVSAPAVSDTAAVPDRAPTTVTAGPGERWKPPKLLVRAIIGTLGLVALAALVVVAAKWLVSLDSLRDFLVTYPGETHLPEETPVGIPTWLAWQHFLNVFFLVLIIRSGWQVRTEQRPAAFWTPKWSKDGKGKISITLWLHQGLDILWLLNGGVFMVLLFSTGQWMRVVPTNWDVFPNALSAALKYASLNWPTEDGWVNYNSLQMIAYFVTIFIAAPLAALTGVRMSGLWPAKAKTLNRIYPVEVARVIHFPVMLYFVVFIIVHVTLVLATGTLRNLNHMYGGQDAVNWTGFWIFSASLVLMAGAVAAARPLILAPIAQLTGKVSGR